MFSQRPIENNSSKQEEQVSIELQNTTGFRTINEYLRLRGFTLNYFLRDILKDPKIGRIARPLFKSPLCAVNWCGHFDKELKQGRDGVISSRNATVKTAIGMLVESIASYCAGAVAVYSVLLTSRMAEYLEPSIRHDLETASSILDPNSEDLWERTLAHSELENRKTIPSLFLAVSKLFQVPNKLMKTFQSGAVRYLDYATQTTVLPENPILRNMDVNLTPIERIPDLASSVSLVPVIDIQLRGPICLCSQDSMTRHTIDLTSTGNKSPIFSKGEMRDSSLFLLLFDPTEYIQTPKQRNPIYFYPQDDIARHMMYVTLTDVEPLSKVSNIPIFDAHRLSYHQEQLFSQHTSIFVSDDRTIDDYIQEFMVRTEEKRLVTLQPHVLNSILSRLSRDESLPVAHSFEEKSNFHIAPFLTYGGIGVALTATIGKTSFASSVTTNGLINIGATVSFETLAKIASKAIASKAMPPVAIAAGAAWPAKIVYNKLAHGYHRPRELSEDELRELLKQYETDYSVQLLNQGEEEIRPLLAERYKLVQELKNAKERIYRQKWKGPFGHLKKAIRLQEECQGMYQDCEKKIQNVTSELALRAQAEQEAKYIKDLKNSVIHHHNEGQYKEAADVCSKVFELRPDDHNFRLIYADTLSKLDRRQDAVTQLKEIIKHDKDNFEALSMLGDIYFRQEKYKEASNAFFQAVELNGTSPETRFNYAISLLKLDENPEATKQFETIVERDPNNVQARHYLGIAYAAQNMFDDAANSFEKYYELGGDSCELRKLYGDVLSKLKEYERAADQYGIYSESHPDDKSAILSYSTACLHLQDFDEAERGFGKLLALDPNDTNGLIGLSNVFFKTGSTKDAMRLFEEASRVQRVSDVSVDKKIIRSTCAFYRAEQERTERQLTLESYKRHFSREDDLDEESLLTHSITNSSRVDDTPLLHMNLYRFFMMRRSARYTRDVCRGISEMRHGSLFLHAVQPRQLRLFDEGISVRKRGQLRQTRDVANYHRATSFKPVNYF